MELRCYTDVTAFTNLLALEEVGKKVRWSNQKTSVSAMLTDLKPLKEPFVACNLYSYAVAKSLTSGSIALEVLFLKKLMNFVKSKLAIRHCLWYEYNVLDKLNE